MIRRHILKHWQIEIYWPLIKVRPYGIRITTDTFIIIDRNNNAYCIRILGIGVGIRSSKNKGR